MKKDYLESNPDAKTMDNTTLKMPPKDYILPKPKPKNDRKAKRYLYGKKRQIPQDKNVKKFS